MKNTPLIIDNQKLGNIPLSDNLFAGDYCIYFTSRYSLRLLLLLLSNVGVTFDKNSVSEKPMTFEINLDVLKMNLGLRHNYANEVLYNLCQVITHSGFCLKTDRKIVMLPFFSFAVLDVAKRVFCCTFNERSQPLLIGANKYFAQMPRNFIEFIKEEWELTIYFNLYTHRPKSFWRISIPDFKRLLGLENKQFADSHRANYHIWERILGIKKPSGWIYCCNKANVPWTNEEKGLLQKFNEHDNTYSYFAYPIMEKGKYTTIQFIIERKRPVICKGFERTASYYENCFMKALTKIQSKVSEADFNCWCSPVQFCTIRENVLSLFVPSRLFLDLLSKNVPFFEEEILKIFPNGTIITYLERPK